MCPVEGHITDVRYSHSGKSRKLIKFTTSHKAAVGYVLIKKTTYPVQDGQSIMDS